MELKELYDKTLELFRVERVEDLGTALLSACNDEAKLDGFCKLVDNDLSKDWLQMIYQYYLADRKEKKQDYTPAGLAKFLSLLVGEADVVVDLCAGSGALTIQRWNQNPEQKFKLYEIDERVIPFLLFNLVIRNISAVVFQGDVLSGETQHSWLINKGEKYGKIFNFKSTL